MTREAPENLSTESLKVVAEDLFKMSLLEDAPPRLLGRLSGEADFKQSQHLAEVETLGLPLQRIANIEAFLAESDVIQSGLEKGLFKGDDVDWLKSRLELEKRRQRGEDLYRGVEPIKTWYYPSGTMAYAEDENYRQLLKHPVDAKLYRNPDYGFTAISSSNIRMDNLPPEAVSFVIAGRSRETPGINLAVGGYLYFRQMDAHRILEFADLTIPGTRTAAVAGGRVFPVKWGDSGYGDYRDRVDHLGSQITMYTQVEGIVVLGPKTDIGDTSLYFDTPGRNLIIIQPEQDEVFMEAFYASRIEKQIKKWHDKFGPRPEHRKTGFWSLLSWPLMRGW